MSARVWRRKHSLANKRARARCAPDAIGRRVRVELVSNGPQQSKCVPIHFGAKIEQMPLNPERENELQQQKTMNMAARLLRKIA